MVDEASQGLRKADCLKALVETKHVELHPIVAALIKGLNELNENKVPRTKALTDPSTVSSYSILYSIRWPDAEPANLLALESI